MAGDCGLRPSMVWLRINQLILPVLRPQSELPLQALRELCRCWLNL